MHTKSLAAMFFAFTLTACSTSSVIQSGPNTFMVSSSGAGFGTGSVRENVFKAANDFAAAKGMVMVPISFKAKPGELGRNPPSADLIFKLAKTGAPSISDSPLTEADQLKIQQDIKIQPTANKDLYTELVKLDDLRKKGIINDREFDEAKSKLLSAQQKQ